MLGKTPGKKYVFKNGKDKVGEYTTFDWWDGVNIENLKVSKKYRGQGISYKLLDHAVHKNNAKNLAVRKDNHIAKHVYDKYGFKETESDDDYSYMTYKRKRK